LSVQGRAGRVGAGRLARRSSALKDRLEPVVDPMTRGEELLSTACGCRFWPQWEVLTASTRRICGPSGRWRSHCGQI